MFSKGIVADIKFLSHLNPDRDIKRKMKLFYFKIAIFSISQTFDAFGLS